MVIWRLCSLLLVTSCFVDLSSAGKSEKRKISEARQENVSKRDKQDAEESASTKANIPLPDISKLLSGAQATEKGMKFTYEGCEMAVEEKNKVINIDLTDAKCKNVASLSKLFTKLTKKEPDDETKKFATLDKFDLKKVSIDRNSKRVSFDAESKEPFNLLYGIKVSGKISMQFTYDKGFKFQNIGINLEGEISSGMEYSIVKQENKNEGELKITTKSITVSKFVKLFNSGKEMVKNGLVDEKDEVNKVTINNPTFQGSRDASGYTEVIMTGSVTNVLGIEKATFVCVVAAELQKPSDVGIIVQFDNISPATILGNFIKKGSKKFDISEMPIFKQMKVTVLIEYANNDISPKSANIVSLLSTVSPKGEERIEKGIRMKFTMPFGDILKAYKVSVPANTELTQYVEVEFENGKVKFSFPPNAFMDVVNIAIAFIPNVAQPTLQKIFKDSAPQVTFEKFEVDVKDGTVDIKLKVTGKIGFRFLSVDSMEFSIQRDSSKNWEFNLYAVKKVGSGEMSFQMEKVEKDYKIIGTINTMSTLEVAATFNVDSKIRKQLESLKAFTFWLEDVKIEIEFGGKMSVHLMGNVNFIAVQAAFEGYFTELDRGELSASFGLVIHNHEVLTVLKNYYEKSGKGQKLGVVNADLLSKVTTSFVFGNDKANFDFGDKNLQAADKPRALGVAVSADITIPNKCQKDDTLCEAVKKVLKADQHLTLSGIFDTEGIEMDMSLKGDIPIGKNNKYTIKELGFVVAAKYTGIPEVGIRGKMTVSFAKQGTVDFKAKLGISALGTITLALEMIGTIDKAFNFEGLRLEDWKLKAGISTLTGLPSFEFAGKIRIGTTKNSIETELAGGFDATSVNIHMYGTLKRWTVRQTIDAFNKDAGLMTKIPKPILDSGFNTASAGFSQPKTTEVKNLGITLDVGFFFKGELNLLGHIVQCEVKVLVPRITMIAKFSKLSIASGLIEITGNIDKTIGPEFQLDMSPNKFILQMDANVKLFGISVGATINIGPDGFKFSVEGVFCKLFKLTAELTAPFKADLKNMAAEEWTIKGCFDTKVVSQLETDVKTEAKAADASVDGADVDAKKIEKKGKIFDSAQKKLDKYTTKLKGYETKLNKMVKETNDNAKDFSKSNKKCIDNCKKKMVQTGKLVMEPCKGLPPGLSLQCPKWKPDAKVISPSCVGACNKKAFSGFSSFFKDSKFKTLQSAMNFYAAVISKLQILLVKARSVAEYSTKAKTLMADIKTRAKKIKEAVKQKINIEKICLNSQLSAKNGWCFSVDAKVKLLNNPYEVKNEQVCMTKEGMKQLAQKVLRAVFPDYDKIKDMAGSIKGMLGLATKENAEQAEKDLEKAENDNYKKRTMEENEADDTCYSHLVTSPPEFVIRNEETIMTYNNLFFRPDTDVIYSNDNGAARNAIPTTAIQIDTAALSDKSAGNACRRSQAAVQVYDGVSSNLNTLLQNNREAKAGYENFTQSWAKQFDSLEQETRATGSAFNLTADQTNEMMFYVQYGREGVANMKRQLDTRFDILDKQSMKQFQTAMGQSISQQNLNMAGFISLMTSASREVAKKWDVPENNMDNDINYAEQIIKSILTSDENGVTTNSADIEKLANSVANMNALSANCK